MHTAIIFLFNKRHKGSFFCNHNVFSIEQVELKSCNTTIRTKNVMVHNKYHMQLPTIYRTTTQKNMMTHHDKRYGRELESETYYKSEGKQSRILMANGYIIKHEIKLWLVRWGIRGGDSWLSSFSLCFQRYDHRPALNVG